jgi:hypothetical protein
MTNIHGLHVEVQQGGLIVSLPGTYYTVTYHKPGKSPQLVAKSYPRKDNPRSALTSGEFLVQAWKLANDKARELGWIA